MTFPDADKCWPGEDDGRLRRDEATRKLRRLGRPAAKPRSQVPQCRTNPGRPKAALKMAPSCLKDPADIPLIEVTLEEIPKHQHGRTPVSIDHQKDSVLIGPADVQIPNRRPIPS